MLNIDNMIEINGVGIVLDKSFKIKEVIMLRKSNQFLIVKVVLEICIVSSFTSF